MFKNKRKLLRQLDVAVVDKAIESINNGGLYSCVALYYAAHPDAHLCLMDENDPYLVAYKTNTWVAGYRPFWWNRYNEKLAEFRIQALQDFREEILKSKKPTILERLKNWLTQPCTVGDY